MKFRYRGMFSGRIESGTLEAPNQLAAANQLEDNGVKVISLEPLRSRAVRYLCRSFYELLDEVRDRHGRKWNHDDWMSLIGQLESIADHSTEELEDPVIHQVLKSALQCPYRDIQGRADDLLSGISPSQKLRSQRLTARFAIVLAVLVVCVGAGVWSWVIRDDVDRNAEKNDRDDVVLVENNEQAEQIEEREQQVEEREAEVLHQEALARRVTMSLRLSEVASQIEESPNAAVKLLLNTDLIPEASRDTLWKFLYRRCSGFTIPDSLAGDVIALAASPDGDTLAYVTVENTHVELVVWRVSTGAVVGRSKFDTQQAESEFTLVFSANARALLLQSGNRFDVWSVEPLRLIRTERQVDASSNPALTSRGDAVVWTRNGNETDASIQILEIETGNRDSIQFDTADAGQFFFIGPLGQWIHGYDAMDSDGRKYRSVHSLAHNAQNGWHVKREETDPGERPASQICYSADRRYRAVSFVDNEQTTRFELRDMRDGRVYRTRATPGHLTILGVGYGGLLAVQEIHRGSAKLIDSLRDRVVRDIPRTYHRQLAMFPAGDIAMVDDSESVVIYRQNPCMAHPRKPDSNSEWRIAGRLLAISSDGRQLATYLSDLRRLGLQQESSTGGVLLWDVRSRLPWTVLPQDTFAEGWGIHSARFSPDGLQLAITWINEHLPRTGQHQRRIALFQLGKAPKLTTSWIENHRKTVEPSAIWGPPCFSTNGRTLVSDSSLHDAHEGPHGITLRNVASGQPVNVRDGAGSVLLVMHGTPIVLDGNGVIGRHTDAEFERIEVLESWRSATDGRKINPWRTVPLSMLEPAIRAESAGIGELLAVSANGRVLIDAVKNEFRRYDLRVLDDNESELSRLRLDCTPIPQVALSPDGSCLAILKPAQRALRRPDDGDHPRIGLWDTSTGRLIIERPLQPDSSVDHMLQTRSEEIRQLKWSESGELLVLQGSQTIYIWQASPMLTGMPHINSSIALYPIPFRQFRTYFDKGNRWSGVITSREQTPFELVITKRDGRQFAGKCTFPDLNQATVQVSGTVVEIGLWSAEIEFESNAVIEGDTPTRVRYSGKLDSNPYRTVIRGDWNVDSKGVSDSGVFELSASQEHD